ncbi:caspase family protein [Pacificimonas sp. WHA3]|uniref:Caspase family protein n=1 Tax=Pacificimonas pallii TaxID=2827236 RepID=A0ABS6SER2_9SPHN|nr:caspase family protein [Pacificimonas pallii]MBV7256879.1 caspase family protein [Pacificimonas pallii]
MKRSRLYCCAAAISLFACAPLNAADHALIIGASTFEDPRLSPYALPGAEKDARAMFEAASTLLGADSEITVLSGADATLGAVRAGFARLQARARKGDRVMIYISAHGTQIPALSDMSEQDGLDEILLLADAQPWDRDRRTIPGGLRDDELGAVLAGLRAHGVSVFLAIDSCTAAGTLRRAKTSETHMRPRALPAAALAIPRSTRRGALPDSSGFADARAFAGGGQFVAFTAGASGTAAWDTDTGGLFTGALVAAIHAGGDTFHDVARTMDSHRRARPLRGPEPALSGDLATPWFFTAGSRSLLEGAQALPRVELSARLTLTGQPDCARATDARRVSTNDRILPRHCDRVDVHLQQDDMVRVDAWYLDTGGHYTPLTEPAGYLTGRSGAAPLTFTFITKDPVSGLSMAPGEELLILFRRALGSDSPDAAQIIRFQVEP